MSRESANFVRSRRPSCLLSESFHSYGTISILPPSCLRVPFRCRLSRDSSPIITVTTRSPQSTAVRPFPGFTHIDSQFSSRAPLKLVGSSLLIVLPSSCN
ncbi:unnamed protein product [Linum trigynum]|uniref:Uncharacterized protein n=1 Tax=Linum trigynum TaxID=586398 RepID=A0AAV2CCZ2_9ROSI